MRLTRRQFLFGAGRRRDEEVARPAATATGAPAIPGMVAAGSTFSLEAFYAARAASGEASERPPVSGPSLPPGRDGKAPHE